MRVVAEETWSWMLLAEDEHLFLSVLCGTVGVYAIDIELNEAERAIYAAEGNAGMARLAAAVSGAPSTFRSRHLPNLDGMPGYDAAIAAWRKAHDRPAG
ncbi:MAG: hypothetical protein AB7P50_21040 [Alphaproteobacteria bacterium]